MPRRAAALLTATAAVLAALLDSARPAGATATDPVAAEVERWLTFVRTNPSTDELWSQVKPGGEMLLGRAQAGLAAGRQLLALRLLAEAQPNLAAAGYLLDRPAAQRKEPGEFEAEWARMGRTLGPALDAPAPASFDGLASALVRALAEIAASRTRIHYRASLDYGRATMPDSGLFYLGAAQAQRELLAFLRSLPSPASAADPRGRPPLRALGPEIADLETRLLGLYRPPASIDRHPEFIFVAGLLKEARELDAAGLHHGALLRWLEAELRTALLQLSSTPPDAAALRRELDAIDARLAAQRLDHTVAGYFIEAARANLDDPAPDSAPTRTAAVVAEVLPRYSAALAPVSAVLAAQPATVPEVTVTLVRWPFT